MSDSDNDGESNRARLSWTIGSRCLIYSRSKSKWMQAEIIDIKGKEKDEWLVVKYGETNDTSKRKKKQIQRYCEDIKPNDAYSYQVGSKCQIFSEISTMWCNGEVIEIYTDQEGEWLTVKYLIKDKDFMACDIQRYSSQIKLINPKQMNVSESDFDDIKTDGVFKGLTDENNIAKFKLIKKTKYNHDCIIFRFELQTNDTVLGLPIGNHVRINFEDDSGDLPISRAYTPITDDSAVGYFELLIKIYENGELTQYLSKMKINEYLDFEGPLGMICYEKPNLLRLKKFDFDTMANIQMYLNVKKIGMLCGGTGINPMYQIIKYVHKNKVIDDTKISCVFSNKTEKDIILKDTLDAIHNINENINIDNQEEQQLMLNIINSNNEYNNEEKINGNISKYIEVNDISTEKYKHFKVVNIIPEYNRNIIIDRDFESTWPSNYCDQCHFIRPIRSKHCYFCGKCITKFDHHCPLVGNCIAAQNYRYFLIFLIFESIVVLWAFYMSINTLFIVSINDVHKHDRDNNDILYKHTVIGWIFRVVFFIVMFMFLFSIIGLTGFHFYLVFTNQTTMELMRPDSIDKYLYEEIKKKKNFI
eukprot:550528_1